MDLFLLVLISLCRCSFTFAEQDERLPNKCEVCKFLTLELQAALDKTGRSKEVLELGEVLDTGRRKRKIKYNTSETRLTEAVDNICEGILQYSVHAERPGSLRYAKGTSQTMSTLKNLVNKGVKVDMGLPYELWDEPSVEVSDMKKQCETMLEQYEDLVEDWYFHHQDQRLERFLCEEHVLKSSEQDNLKGQAELNSHPTQGPAGATASSEEDPFGTIRTTGKHKVRTVVVKCHEDSLEVVINADLFGHGWSVEPTHLRLGPVGESGDQCKVLVPPGNEEYTIKAQLSECGTEIMFVEDAVIFRNHLVYTPTPPLPGDVWQIKGVTIPIHCIYRRRYRVSSHALIPTLINTQSTHLDLHFHLKLMTNDWTGERDSSVYFLGDMVHIQAAVAVAVQLPLRLYIDSCVATLSPDVNSYPRYAFIDHQGCFTDAQLTSSWATGSSSRFLPRVWDELLHIQLQPFLFRRDARNTVSKRSKSLLIRSIYEFYSTGVEVA